MLCSISGPPRSVDTLQVREPLMPCLARSKAGNIRRDYSITRSERQNEIISNILAPKQVKPQCKCGSVMPRR